MNGAVRTIILGIMAGVIALAASAQDTQYKPIGELIPAPDCLNFKAAWDSGQLAPCPADSHERWLHDLQHWRMELRIRAGYDPARYEQSATRWSQSSFIQPQMMVQDRYFYDPVAGRYTVDRYLDDLEKRYGGIDSVLVWSTYPNMGTDDRNQLDMVASMPGGLDGVRQMVADFHRRGVRVLFPMMMWDQGTRQPTEPWPDAIAALMKRIDADGINGDTQMGVPPDFPIAAEKIGHPLVYEPEGAENYEDVSWDLMGWGYYTYPFIPMVDEFKWLETRHMTNICDRWNRDHTTNLQYAFFNGEGFETWENVWGIWNGINPRDAEGTRRVAAIERGVAPFLVSPDWEPHYPMGNYGVYASRWPLGGEAVWTVVNRNNYNIGGPQMSVPFTPGLHYFDLYHGTELKPEISGQSAVLSFNLEANAYGAILATPAEPSEAIKNLMQRMAAMTKEPLASFSHESPILPQSIVEIAPTAPATEAPSGMVKIPGGSFVFKVRGIEIEGHADPGVDVQYPWEDSPRRSHEKVMQVTPFYIDKFPVTNAQFKEFLDATHYAPKDPINFLRDWKNGSYPQGWENRPVTWVSLEDARAYAKWAGKRLPHEWEWQMAAQGTDGRLFPWGNQWQAANVPTPVTGRATTAPDPVDAHPAGASPYGVMDMVGNVWQWTDEFIDEHTRGGILRGGEYYKPQGSKWYFPDSFRNDEHGKLLLMAAGYDRSGGVGFRCVRDAE